MSQKSDSEDGPTASDVLKKFTIPEFLKKGRANPINGKRCFFSETTFQRVVGPEPSLSERFKIQIARARARQSEKPESKKKRHKDLDLPDEKKQDTSVLKSPSDDTLPKIERLHNFSEVASSDVSTDDDEISTNLVIADDEEQGKGSSLSESVSPVKETCKPIGVSPVNETCKSIEGVSPVKETCKSIEGVSPVKETCKSIEGVSPVKETCKPIGGVSPVKETCKSIEGVSPVKETCKSTGGVSLVKETCKATGSVSSVKETFKSTERLSFVEETCESIAPINPTQKTENEDASQSSDKTNAGQTKSAAESLHHDKRDIPLYAEGITTRRKSSLALPVTEDRQEKLALTDKECAENKGAEKIAESTGKPEGGISLVLPPPGATNSNNDKNNSTTYAEIKTLDPSTSTLPLIPALMSKPAKVCTAEDSQHSERTLPKLDVAPKFYLGDHSPATPHPQSQHPSPRASTEAQIFVRKNTSKMNDEDVDVPIFSVANSSDDSNRGNVSRRSLRNRGIWSTEPQNVENTSKQKSFLKDNTVKESINFKKSDLTREEMAFYLNLYGKYVRPYLYGGCCPMFTQKQKDEMAQFEILQQRVQREQGQFQAYLQQNAFRNPGFYKFTKAYIKHYAYEKAQMFRPQKNVLKKFSNVLAAKIPLQANSEQVELTFQQHLLQIGSPPKIVLPDLKSGNNPVPIPHDLDKLTKHFPNDQRNENADSLHHESVSDDANAQKLAVKYSADAVLSSSVVKCLMNNRGPGFSRSWNIVVTVREHQTEGGTKKVVYFHKPVFEGDLLLRDYNALFHKYALRVMVSHPKHSLPHGLRQSEGEAGTRAADDPFDMFTSDLEALETFGKSMENKDEGTSCRRSKRIIENTQGKKSTEGEDVSLAETKSSLEKSPETGAKVNCSPSLNDSLEQLPPTPGRLRKRPPNSSPVGKNKSTEKDKTLASPAKRVKEEANLTDQSTAAGKGSPSLVLKESPVKPSSMRGAKRRVAAGGVKRPLHIQPQLFSSGDAQTSGNLLDLILGPNVTVGETQEEAFQENPSQYIPHSESLSSLVYSQWTLGQNKILIRTRSQGVLKAHNVYLTAKMEYQTSHGLEQVTAEETVRDWTACYLRPNTRLVRARINVFSSEILMFEELEAHQILRTGSNIRPLERFSFINSLLKHLKSLEEGNYLVSHEAGSDYCGVRVQKSGARLDKLEAPVAFPPFKDRADGPVPWIPIDPNLLLPYHVLHQRIPATFLPKDVVIANLGPKKSQKDVNAANQGGKKKKKKRKFPKKSNNMEREFFI